MDTHDTDPRNYDLTGEYRHPGSGEFYLAELGKDKPKVSFAKYGCYEKRYIVVPKQETVFVVLDSGPEVLQAPPNPALQTLEQLLNDANSGVRLEAAKTLLNYEQFGDLG